MRRHAVFIGMSLVMVTGCPAQSDRERRDLRRELREARGELREAKKQLKQAGHEFGQAARRTADRLDRVAGHAGLEASERVRHARKDLERTRRIIDDAADALSSVPPVPTNQRIDDGIRCASEHYVIDRQLYEDAFTNPLALMRQVRWEAVKDAGATSGYRVTAIEPSSVAARLGIRPGDIITAIDGQRIADTPPQQLLQRLRKADDVTITVQRHGRRFDKTIDVDAWPRRHDEPGATAQR